MRNMIVSGDFLVRAVDIPDSSVSLVFADLPYGITKNEWDTRLPLEPLWSALNRVGKPDCVFVFTADFRFGADLYASNPSAFRFDMVWHKTLPKGFLNARRVPLRTHENLLVFYRRTPRYFPQMTEGHGPTSASGRRGLSPNYNTYTLTSHPGGKTSRFPTSILTVSDVNNRSKDRVHPTQKPEALISWFIRSYTKEGDLVLDPVCGSGSTCIAAKRLRRDWLGFEKDPEMAKIADSRVHEM